MRDPQGGEEEVARRRLKGFRVHLLGYFVVAVLLVAVNLLLTPGTVWFVWPIVGWGGVLAIHAAYAMGLFWHGEL